jgi:hypothetical protein
VVYDIAFPTLSKTGGFDQGKWRVM